MLLELIDVSTGTALFLILIAFIAGFLDTLAGGGGLLTLPALILSGLPPLASLGTNKLQGTMGTATASIIMLRTRRVGWQEVRFLMLAAFLGSAFGTAVVHFIDTGILQWIIPVVLFLTAMYFLFAPLDTFEGRKPLLSIARYRKTVVPLIGCYDGMFGPGTGSFFALAGVSLRGLGLIDATAVAKTLNFSTNVASLIVFGVTGKVVWLVGLLMMAGQFVGAWIGSHCLFKIDVKYLRLLVVIMCLGMLARYGYSSGWLRWLIG